MYKLNKQTKTAIKKYTGIDYPKFNTLSIEDLDNLVEQKIGKKLKFKPLNDQRLIGRGSVYFYLNRFLNLKYISKILSKI